MKEIDWDNGSPQKLKNIEINKLEKLFAEVVEKIVNGEGHINANISSIDFHPHSSLGTVEMKISFSERHDTKFFDAK